MGMIVGDRRLSSIWDPKAVIGGGEVVATGTPEEVSKVENFCFHVRSENPSLYLVLCLKYLRQILSPDGRFIVYEIPRR